MHLTGPSCWLEAAKSAKAAYLPSGSCLIPMHRPPWPRRAEPAPMQRMALRTVLQAEQRRIVLCKRSCCVPACVRDHPRQLTLDGWTDARGRTHARAGGRADRRVDGSMGAWMDGWTGGCTDERMSRRMHGRTDGCGPFGECLDALAGCDACWPISGRVCSRVQIESESRVSSAGASGRCAAGRTGTRQFARSTC